MNILTAPVNLPFTIALGIVLLLGILEVVSLLLGGAASVLGGDNAVAVGGPDGALDVDGPDVDSDIDGVHTDGALGHLMEWLHVGHLPATVLLIVFLLSFGGAGLGLQTALKETTGGMLPSWLASIPALLIAFPATRVLGGLIKPVMPRDETEAVSRDSFLGCEAQITVGTSRRGKPAEARLRDRFGRSHYVMVEPEHDGDVFATGHQVLILRRDGDTFRAIDNAHGVLED